MNPVKVHLRLQPAPADLLRTAVHGQGRSVYVPAPSGSVPAPGPGECIWTDGTVSLFVTARQGDDGPVVDLCVTVDPPAPAAGTAALAA